MSCGKAIKLYCIKHEHPQLKTRRIFILTAPTDKAIEGNRFESDSPLLLLFTTAHARTEQSYGLVPFLLFKKKGLSEIQNKPTRCILIRGKNILALQGSAVIFIRMPAALVCFFPPPAFQDNNLNVNPELHFAFLKHCGNL